MPDEPQDQQFVRVEIAPGTFVRVPANVTPEQLSALQAEYAPKPQGLRERAASFIRQAGPMLPSAIPLPGVGGAVVNKAVADQIADVVARPAKALPILGGIGAAAATGGMSVPLQIAATALGGAAGRLGQAAVEREPMNAQTAQQVALEGALQGGIQGVGTGLKAAGPALKRAGVWGYQKLLKPNVGALMKLPGASRAGPEEMARRVSETLIKRGAIRRGTVTKIAEEKEALQEAADAGIAGSSAEIVPSVPARNVEPIIKDYQTANARREIAQAKRVLGEHETNPTLTDPIVDRRTGMLTGQRAYKPTVPIQDAVKVRQIHDRILRGAYGSQSKNAEIEARKALAAGWREQIASQEPQVAEQYKQISELIPAEDALERALWRAGNVNPITLPESIVGSAALFPVGGGPAARSMARVSGIMLNRPLIGSTVARGAYGAGNRLETAPNVAQLIRALLLGALGGEEEGIQ